MQHCRKSRIFLSGWQRFDKSHEFGPVAPGHSRPACPSRSGRSARAVEHNAGHSAAALTVAIFVRAFRIVHDDDAQRAVATLIKSGSASSCAGATLMRQRLRDHMTSRGPLPDEMENFAPCCLACAEGPLRLHSHWAE